MKTGPGRKRERDRKSRKIVQNLLGRRGGRGGRAVIAEIRAKRNDADAGKRVRRENERSGKIFFIWSRPQGTWTAGMKLITQCMYDAMKMFEEVIKCCFNMTVLRIRLCLHCLKWSQWSQLILNSDLMRLTVSQLYKLIVKRKESSHTIGRRGSAILQRKRRIPWIQDFLKSCFENLQDGSGKQQRG